MHVAKQMFISEQFDRRIMCSNIRPENTFERIITIAKRNRITYLNLSRAKICKSVSTNLRCVFEQRKGVYNLKTIIFRWNFYAINESTVWSFNTQTLYDIPFWYKVHYEHQNKNYWRLKCQTMRILATLDQSLIFFRFRSTKRIKTRTRKEFFVEWNK